MLQIDKSPPTAVSDSGVQRPEDQSPAELYAAAVAFIKRQYHVIIFVTLLVMGLGVVYVFTEPPRYTATAEMIIDTHRLQVFQQQSPVNVDLSVDTAAVDSQVEILKSENIALSVVKEQHLADDSEFVGSSGGLVSAVFGVIGSISNIFSSAEPPSEYALTRHAVERFQKRLKIKRVEATYVIEIQFQSLTPDRAARIANAVADAYVVDALEAKYQATRRAALWLQDRLKELRQQASNAERAVVDFKAKNNIVESGGRLMNEQQLAELNSALILARANTAEAQARMERVTQILKAEEGRSGAFQDTATVTDTLHDDVITRLRQQYLDIASREADWSARYGAGHLAAVNLRNQMHEIRRSIDDELRRIAETYKSDYEIAKSREDAVQKGLDEIVSQSNQTNQAQVQLHELDSSAQSYRAISDNFLQQYMISVQQQSFPITESRLITAASPPLKPSHPKTLLVLAAAIAGGLLLAFGVGMLREFSDRVFRTSSQVENQLQTDCIAVVPRLKSGRKQAVPEDDDASYASQTFVRGQNLLWQVIDALFSRFTESIGAVEPTVKADRKQAEPEVSDASFAPRAIVRSQNLLWEVIDTPFSRFTESIRAIKMASDLVGVSRSNKVIAITSSLPNEGKSTIATSLAQLMVHTGSKVILVDGDLRNPSLTHLLAPTAGLGLIEVISGKASLQDVIWTDPSTNLAFLPVFAKSRIAHSSEILGSAATKKLFDNLRESYDYVIVDLSPLAPVVDVRATAGLVDSYVFVIEWGRTKFDVVEHALRNARGVFDNLLGIVLNKADLKVLSRYDAYRGNYYKNKHYIRYGYAD